VEVRTGEKNACPYQEPSTGCPSHNQALYLLIYPGSLYDLRFHLSYLSIYLFIESQDSSVVIVTGYGQHGRGPIPGRGKKIFSSPQREDRLWGSLEESSRAVELTTHLHLVPKSTMVVLYLHSPIRLYGVVFN
jgi:hypothetical protein